MSDRVVHQVGGITSRSRKDRRRPFVFGFYHKCVLFLAAMYSIPMLGLLLRENPPPAITPQQRVVPADSEIQEWRKQVWRSAALSNWKAKYRNWNILHVFVPRRDGDLAWSSLYRAQQHIANLQAQARRDKAWDTLEDLHISTLCIIEKADQEFFFQQEPPLCRSENTMDGTPTWNYLFDTVPRKLMEVRQTSNNNTDDWQDVAIFGNSNVAVTERFYLYLRRTLQKQTVDFLTIRSFPVQTPDQSSPHTVDSIEKLLEKQIHHHAKAVKDERVLFAVSPKLFANLNLDGLQVGSDVWSRLFRQLMERFVASHFLTVGNDGRRDEVEHCFAYHLPSNAAHSQTVLSREDAKAILPCLSWSSVQFPALEAVAEGTSTETFSTPWIENARVCAKLTKGLANYILSTPWEGGDKALPPPVFTPQGLAHLNDLVDTTMTVLTEWHQDGDEIEGVVRQTWRKKVFDIGGRAVTSSIGSQVGRAGSVVLTQSGSRYLLLNPLNITQQKKQGREAASSSRPIVALTDWSWNEDGTISAAMFNSTDPEMPVGSRVRTSKVQGAVEGGKIITTFSGSRYYLLPQHLEDE